MGNGIPLSSIHANAIGTGRRRRLPAAALLAGAGGLCHAAQPAQEAAWPATPATLIVIALAVVALAHGCGWLARRLGQPALLGQVGAGVLLGPSLPAPQWSTTGAGLLTEPLSTVLLAIAQVGLGIHLLRAGLQLAPPPLRAAARGPLFARALIFALGASLAAWFAGPSGTSVERLAFALLIGCALALCVPVERPAQPDPLFGLLPVAAVALLLGNRLPALAALAYAAVLIAAAALLARPWLARQARRELSARLGIQLALLALIAAAALEPLGLPAVLAALAVGALLRRADRPAQLLERLLLPLQTVLLPAFFLGVGLRIDLSGLAWATALAIGGGVIALVWLGALAGALAPGPADAAKPRSTLIAAAAWIAPGALALFALQLGVDSGLLPRPLYSTLTLALLAAALPAALAANGPAPPSTGPGRCVLLYRIAP